MGMSSFAHSTTTTNRFVPTYRTTECNGSTSGTSSTWTNVYESYEKPGVRACFTTPGKVVHNITGGPSFDTSVIKLVSELRSPQNGRGSGHVVVYEMPEGYFRDNQHDKDAFQWFLRNVGAYLTGESRRDGSSMHLAANSLASVAWDLAEESTPDTRRNFITCVTWVSKFFNMLYTETDSYSKATKDTLELLIKQESSQNILKPIASTVILASMGKSVNKWNLLSKIFISVSRTFHDCGKTLVSSDALGRVFVFYVLLNLLNGSSIEDVVNHTRDEFKKEYCSLKRGDPEIRVISVLLKKIFPEKKRDVLVFGKNQNESIHDIASAIYALMVPKKLTSVTKFDICKHLKTKTYIAGYYFKPFIAGSDPFVTGENIAITTRTDKQIAANFKKAKNWGSLAIKIPPDVASGTIKV